LTTTSIADDVGELELVVVRLMPSCELIEGGFEFCLDDGFDDALDVSREPGMMTRSERCIFALVGGYRMC
jgi:hypothetical protein